MADISLTEQTGKNLEKALRDLTSAVGKSGGSGIGSSAQAKTSNGNNVDENSNLKKRIKLYKDYEDSLKRITKQAKEQKDLEDKLKQIEEVRVAHAKKVKELYDVTTAKQKVSGAEKKKFNDLTKAGIKLEAEKLLKLQQETDQLKLQIASHADLTEEQKKIAGVNEKIAKSDKNRDETNQNIKKTAGSIWEWGSKILNNIIEQDTATSKLSANYALSKRESGNLKDNIGGILSQSVLLGISATDIANMQSSYTNNLGRSVLLSKEGMVAIGQTSVALGLGVEGTADMVAEMDKFGVGVENGISMIGDLMQTSKNAGVSASVAAKAVASNLKLANTFNFKDGVNGVLRMNTFATQMKISMSDVAALASKVSDPAGALESSAALSVLGGSFAQMADPLTLMNQGINDMEGLSKTYAKMLEGAVSIDKVTGAVTENGYEKLRLKSAAAAINVNFESAMETARNLAKRKSIGTNLEVTPVLKNADEDTKNMLASLATMKNGEWGVNIKGEQKSLTKLTKEDLNYLKPDSVQVKEVAQNTLGIKEILENNLTAILSTMSGPLLSTMSDISGILLKVSDFVFGKTNNAGGISGGIIPTKGNAAAASTGFIAGGIGGGMISAGGGLLSAGASTIGKAATIIGGGAGLGGLISAGSEYAQSGSVSRAAGAGLGGFGGSAIGGAIGTMIAPGIGTAVGMALGSYLGSKYGAGAMDVDHADDMFVPSEGKPILLNSRDSVFSVKAGGAIMNALQPRNTVQDSVEPTYSGTYSGGSSRNVGNGKFELNLTGGITLNVAGGNSSRIDANELIKNKQFVRELARLISQTQNFDKNSGYSGPLSSDSF